MIRHESYDNGNIRVENCRGEIHVKTNNGEIAAWIDSLDRSSEFISQNGSIHATIYQIGADTKLETENGDIHLRIPRIFEGRLEAKTHNGDIWSDIPVRVHSPRERELIGQIGYQEGPTLFLTSHNGNVCLLSLQKEERGESQDE